MINPSNQSPTAIKPAVNEQRSSNYEIGITNPDSYREE